MYQTLSLFPGVTLRAIQSDRFKQGVLSIAFLRPMCAQEAACNALIPAVLLRGCEQAPDLRRITARLDDLYGASVSAQVSRIGDCQTTGFLCSFIDDRFAMPGDRVLEPMIELVGQLLLHPLREADGFCAKYVRGEKRNLIAALEARRNDKQVYATDRLIRTMCRGDSFAVPRLGTVSAVRRISAPAAYAHYQTLLHESPIEIFYVGSADAERVAAAFRPIFAHLRRTVAPFAPRGEFVPARESHRTEVMDIAQGKLAMGFVTPITDRDPRFAAMQLCNAVFGAGQTSKLFMQVREKSALCYDIGSSYYASKGVVLVHAGTDSARADEVRQAVCRQLEECQTGNITQEELENARETFLSALRTVYDSPEAIRSYFASWAVNDTHRTPEQYARELCAVTLADVVDAARTLRLHSSFTLKGATHE